MTECKKLVKSNYHNAVWFDPPKPGNKAMHKEMVERFKLSYPKGLPKK